MISWPLEIGPTGYSETSVRNYHYTQRKIPEERRHHKFFRSKYLFFRPIFFPFDNEARGTSHYYFLLPSPPKPLLKEPILTLFTTGAGRGNRKSLLLLSMKKTKGTRHKCDVNLSWRTVSQRMFARQWTGLTLLTLLGLSNWLYLRHAGTLSFKRDLARWRRDGNDMHMMGRYNTISTQHSVSSVEHSINHHTCITSVTEGNSIRGITVLLGYVTSADDAGFKSRQKRFSLLRKDYTGSGACRVSC
jgi:hypothetical protein